MTHEEAQALLATIELHRLAGLDLTEWGDGEVTFSFAPPAPMRDPATEGVHGGALATALDTAACFAVISRIGADCATVDLRLDYVRPARDAAFVARGSVIRCGKRFGWSDATLETLDGRLVAAARGTFAW